MSNARPGAQYARPGHEVPSKAQGAKVANDTLDRRVHEHGAQSGPTTTSQAMHEHNAHADDARSKSSGTLEPADGLVPKMARMNINIDERMGESSEDQVTASTGGVEPRIEGAAREDEHPLTVTGLSKDKIAEIKRAYRKRGSPRCQKICALEGQVCELHHDEQLHDDETSRQSHLTKQAFALVQGEQDKPTAKQVSYMRKKRKMIKRSEKERGAGRPKP